MLLKSDRRRREREGVGEREREEKSRTAATARRRPLGLYAQKRQLCLSPACPPCPPSSPALRAAGDHRDREHIIVPSCYTNAPTPPALPPPVPACLLRPAQSSGNVRVLLAAEPAASLSAAQPALALFLERDHPSRPLVLPRCPDVLRRFNSADARSLLPGNQPFRSSWPGTILLIIRPLVNVLTRYPVLRNSQHLDLDRC